MRAAGPVGIRAGTEELCGAGPGLLLSVPPPPYLSQRVWGGASIPQGFGESVTPCLRWTLCGLGMEASKPPGASQPLSCREVAQAQEKAARWAGGVPRRNEGDWSGSCVAGVLCPSPHLALSQGGGTTRRAPQAAQPLMGITEPRLSVHRSCRDHAGHWHRHPVSAQPEHCPPGCQGEAPGPDWGTRKGRTSPTPSSTQDVGSSAKSLGWQ